MEFLLGRLSLEVMAWKNRIASRAYILVAGGYREIDGGWETQRRQGMATDRAVIRVE